MIGNIHKNRMGTVSFDGKFKGMRKAQNFIIYPVKTGEQPEKLLIQSDTRIGYVMLADGKVIMSPSVQSGAYNHHLMKATHIDNLTGEELTLLKAQVFATASGHAGGNGVVYVDNSGAMDIFNTTKEGK